MITIFEWLFHNIIIHHRVFCKMTLCEEAIWLVKFLLALGGDGVVFTLNVFTCTKNPWLPFKMVTLAYVTRVWKQLHFVTRAAPSPWVRWPQHLSFLFMWRGFQNHQVPNISLAVSCCFGVLWLEEGASWGWITHISLLIWLILKWWKWLFMRQGCGHKAACGILKFAGIQWRGYTHLTKLLQWNLTLGDRVLVW